MRALGCRQFPDADPCKFDAYQETATKMYARYTFHSPILKSFHDDEPQMRLTTFTDYSLLPIYGAGRSSRDDRRVARVRHLENHR